MKRVKMMLTAIGVLAVVGSAVAFKAAKFGGQTYCTALAGSTFCPTKVQNKEFIGGATLRYRQIPQVANCSTSTVCTGTGNIQE